MEKSATHSKLWHAISEAIDDYLAQGPDTYGASEATFIERRILAGVNKNRTPKEGPRLTTSDLIPGRVYKMRAGDFAEFSRIGGTGLAIFHPPGESDMQSSFAINPELVDREATPEETARL